MFLSTKGTNKEQVSPELVKFLKYVDKPTVVEQEDDEFVSALREAVKKVKESREMGALYMIWEEEIEEAFAEGKAEGEISKLVAQIKIKLGKGQTVEQIADALEESIETIEELMKEYL